LPGNFFPACKPMKAFVNHTRRSLPASSRIATGVLQRAGRRRGGHAGDARRAMAANAKEAAKKNIAEDEEPAPKAGRRPSLKLVLAGALLLFLLLGGGAGAYFVFAAKEKDAADAVPPPKPVAFLDLPDVLVNLSIKGSERPQYLKVKVVLEVADQAVIQQIQPVMPRVMDAFQTYLRELRPSDLDGSAGLYRLKEELTRRVNVAIEPARVNAVLFKELVIQ
jgi:flagellar FliL protein